MLAVVATAALVAAGSRDAPLPAFWQGGQANRLLLLLDVLPIVALGVAGMLGYAALAGRTGTRSGGPGQEGLAFRDRIRRAFPVALIGVTTGVLALFSAGEFLASPDAPGSGAVEVQGVGIFRTPWGMSHWFEMGAVAREGADEAERSPGAGSGTAVSGDLLRRGLLFLAGVAGLVGLWIWYRRRASRARAQAEDEAAAEVERRAVERALRESIEAMLADPDPNTAIRGAYARLLAALGERGRGRWDHEGPFEHLQRVLRTLRIRPAPLHELLGLFELARFSPHALTTTHRDRALLALRAVATELESAL